MAKTTMQRGPIAQRVAENVRTLRKERGLDLEDVANELASLGWPISVSGLSKLELGQRRADVDDLVALAIVLDVSPNRLLLPATARPDVSVQMTLDLEATERKAWEWATGESVLTETPGRFDLGRFQRLRLENRPHDPPTAVTGGEFFEKHKLLSPAVDAVLRVSEETGWSRRDTLEAIDSSLTFVDIGRALERKAAELEGDDDGVDQ